MQILVMIYLYSLLSTAANAASIPDAVADEVYRLVDIADSAYYAGDTPLYKNTLKQIYFYIPKKQILECRKEQEKKEVYMQKLIFLNQLKKYYYKRYNAGIEGDSRIISVEKKILDIRLRIKQIDKGGFWGCKYVCNLPKAGKK